MPDATITSTASTFGTISGTFAADQSTITGTITAITGTVDGSVGVPGPQGPAGAAGPQGPQGDPGAPGQGVAAGGTTGQVLQKLSATSYDTGWLTLGTMAAQTASDYSTTAVANGLYYPLSGNPSGFLTASALTPYLEKAGGIITGNITSNNNSSFISFDNVYKTATLNSASVQLNNAGPGGSSLTIEADGITFPGGGISKQTVAYPGIAALDALFYPLSGNPSGFLTDAPSNGSQYARKNGAWDVVSASAYITSVSSPLSVTTGNLTIDLSAYLTSATASATYQTLAGMSSYLTTATAASTYYLQTNPSGFQTAGDVTTALSPYLLSATAASTYAVIAAGQPVAGSAGQVLTKQSGSNWDSIWATPVVGDRYLTSSTTSNTVSNGNKTFTIGTGLSYTPTQNITISYDASNHMHGEVLTYNSGTGVLTVDINHHTGSGTYTAWVVNVGGVTPATSVAWGAITGTLSSQTDLQSALDLKLAATTAATTYYPLVGNPSGFLTSAPVTSVAGKIGVVTLDNTDISGLGTMSTATAADYSTTAVANGLYYPLAGNPSSFLVAADITGKANLASPSFTGNVSISSSTGAALFIEQTGTGNILTLHDQATDTTFVTIDANGKVSTIASDATNGAGFNIAHGAAPTSPVNGDIWTTTSGLFMRQNGTSRQYVDFDSSQTINGNKTFSNATSTFGSSTATGTISVASGATISASTKTVNVATGGVVGSTTLTTIGPVLGASTTSIGNTTAASTLNLATGATLTATTKAVNIGTAGVAGSTTNITIGSTTGTSTTTLQGITNGITQTAGDSSLKLATTAFVTAAIPATATHLQALQFASTTAVAKVADAASQIVAPSVLCVWPSPSNYNGTATSGAGASATLYLTGYALTSPSAGTAGNARAYHGNVAGDTNYMMWGGSGNSLFNFSKRVSMSFRFSQYPSDANSVTRVLFGKVHGTAVGDLSSRGIGVKYVPTASTYYFYLQAHNGTTLVNVQSSVQYAGGVADLEVVSDGAGNATLYLNGVSVATTTGAPTGSSASNVTVFAEVESQATTTVQPVASVGRLFINSNNF